MNVRIRVINLGANYHVFLSGVIEPQNSGLFRPNLVRTTSGWWREGTAYFIRTDFFFKLLVLFRVFYFLKSKILLLHFPIVITGRLVNGAAEMEVKIIWRKLSYRLMNTSPVRLSVLKYPRAWSAPYRPSHGSQVKGRCCPSFLSSPHHSYPGPSTPTAQNTAR